MNGILILICGILGLSQIPYSRVSADFFPFHFNRGTLGGSNTALGSVGGYPGASCGPRGSNPFIHPAMAAALDLDMPDHAAPDNAPFTCSCREMMECEPEAMMRGYQYSSHCNRRLGLACCCEAN